jgi:hypothetical protein
MGIKKMDSNIGKSKIEFFNRECRNSEHHECEGKWHGLGFEVYCSCFCHHKKGEVLEWVGGPVANTMHDIQPFSLGDTKG